MLIENEHLKQFTSGFSRSCLQINGLLESDAELIRLDNKVLAITTDNIVEEISSGLYADPYQIGWMSVVVNLSDLAAVGAEPLGINISLNMPSGTGSEYLAGVGAGIEDACKLHKTHVLGGDTNWGNELMVGGTGIGIIRDDKIVLRKGVLKGDLLFATQKMGLGNAYGVSRLIQKKEDFNFYPKARLDEGNIVRQFATSCIDTSDGFIPAISNLMEINGMGYDLEQDLNDIVGDEIRSSIASEGVPPWMLLAGPHGEFELLFTVPESNVKKFLQAAQSIDWQPVYLGRAGGDPTLSFRLNGNSLSCDPSWIANLFTACGGDVHHYFNELQKINQSWLQQIFQN